MLPLLPALMSAAPGIISGIGQLFGGKRRKEQENQATSGMNSLAQMLKAQLSGDYMDTGEAQGAIRSFKDNQTEQMNQINAMSNVNSLTDEARIAMMRNQNKNSQGFFNQLAQNGDLYRSRLTNQYQGVMSNLFGMGQQNRQNFNQSLSNIVNPMQDGINSGFASGAFDKMFSKAGK